VVKVRRALTSHILRAWKMRPAAGEMKGIILAKELSSIKAERVGSIKLITGSVPPVIGPDGAGLVGLAA
jgi:hypothetical protein